MNVAQGRGFVDKLRPWVEHLTGLAVLQGAAIGLGEHVQTQQGALMPERNILHGNDPWQPTQGTDKRRQVVVNPRTRLSAWVVRYKAAEALHPAR